MKVGTDSVLLGAWADVNGCQHILDLGTGCGIIALMAAQRAPEAKVTGVELDPNATLDALDNARRSPFAARVETICADILRFTPDVPPQCLLSNPPYFEEELLPPSSARATARHTTAGISFPALVATARRLLQHGEEPRRLAIILPTQAITRFHPLATLHGFALEHRTDVVTKPGKPAKRTLLSYVLNPTERPSEQTDELILMDTYGNRSEAYSRLCRDFYL